MAFNKLKGFQIDAKAISLAHLADEVTAKFTGWDTSIQNILPGVVDCIGPDDHPGLLLVRVAIGSSSLIARLTRRSADQLGLEPGKPVFAQVKSVALLE